MPAFSDFPRWFLLGILVYAPWAFGSTRPWTKEVLTGLLLGLAALFAVSLLWERRRPVIPRFPLFLCGALFLLGWIMVLNPRAVFDPVGPQFHPLATWVPELPGTMDQKWSIPKMALITGLLGAFLVACDLVVLPSWRERLWLTMALVGVSIIFLGLIQRVAGAPSILWEWGVNTGKTFFGTYRYHANAGAFINLILPFVIARAVLTFRRPSHQMSRAFWCVCSFAVVAAAFINVSRAAMLVTVFLLGLVAVWLFFDLRLNGAIRRSRLFMGLAAVVGAVLLLAFAFGTEKSGNRWKDGAEGLFDDNRYDVYGIILKHTLPVSGWRGFGPGTFEITFPLSIKESGNAQVGRWLWRYSHQDYLQTLVEWGWIGVTLWIALLAGALVFGLVVLCIGYVRYPSEHRLLLGAAVLSLCGIGLHALVDFPLQIASLQLYTAMACALLWTAKLPPASRRRKRRVRQTEDLAEAEEM